MLAAALYTLLSTQIQQTATWFGPAFATFRVEFGGNPYDPEVNDVRVRFVGPKGEKVERLAYYDGDGAWKAVLVAPAAGKYKAILLRNGEEANEPAAEGTLDVSQPVKMGFIKVDPVAKNRFRRDTGQPYYPNGFDLGWQDNSLPDLTEQLAKMGQAKVNWTRIWACSWDGKNPWWPNDKQTVEPGELWQPALQRWDKLVSASEKSGVSFQFVLFHHGEFASKTDPNWPENPWNTKNGGFLKNSADFFTDPEAKRRSKLWLRYAVARYGASPNVMAWELFNEVQWVDAVAQNRWADISAWHKEMAAYLRSIDPYHHLVTTSSVMEPASLWADMDYVQPHTYPANIVASVSGEQMPKDRPGFFGEFGPSGDATAPAHRVVRDGIYGGMLANHAGPGMYWYWDNVEKQNLYPDFFAAGKVIEASDIALHPNARRLDLGIETAGSADLVFAPGGGWSPLKKAKLSFPADISGPAASGVPEYFQGKGHRDLFAEPLSISFTAAKPGSLRLNIRTVAQAGADIKISVNGKQVAEKSFPAADKNYPGEVIEAPFPAGPVTVSIANDGADWVQVQSISMANSGPELAAIGLGETDWAVVRLAHVSGVKGPVTGSITGLSLAPAIYEVITVDATTGETKSETKTINDFRLTDWVFPSADTVLIFKRK